MKSKVTVIGGGTGLSVILRGLKKIPNIELSAVVTVADDGGSTGRLREQYQIPAMGDMRSVILALSEEEGLFNSLMNYRFDGEEDIGGHNLGNLILTALTQISGSFNEAIDSICKVLNVKGNIYPATNEVISLYALMDDGVVVKGEHNIPEYQHHIQRVFYDHDVSANLHAVDAIRQADLLILGIGSLYTSILPNLIIDSISTAFRESKGKKVYLCNAMSQSGETDGYSVEDHVQAIHEHLGAAVLDLVVVNKTEIPDEILAKYRMENSHAIRLQEASHPYQILEEELLDLRQSLVRHDEQKLAQIIADILKESGL